MSAYIRSLVLKDGVDNFSQTYTATAPGIHIVPPPKEIPILGEISAGRPTLQGDPTGETILVPHEALALAGKNPSAVRVCGRSMHPTIRDGTVILIRRSVSAKPGKIVAAEVDGMMTLKRLVGDRLASDNPEFPDVTPAQESVIRGVYITTINESP